MKRHKGEIPKARNILGKLGKKVSSKDGTVCVEVPMGLVLLDDSQALRNETDEYNLYGFLGCDYIVNQSLFDEDIDLL